MSVARHRAASFRPASLPMLLFAGGCLAARTADGVALNDDSLNAGVDVAPPSPSRCSTRDHEARLISTAAATVPEVIWARHPSRDAAVRFRLDEAGVPSSIAANVTSDSDGRDALERLTVQAIAGYRFCLPDNAAEGGAYVERRHFAYSRLGAKHDHAETYVQQFVPGYTAAEIAARRAGRVEVRGTFSPDGRPTSVESAESSGDSVLDAKSLDAMARRLLVFRDGSAISTPVVFVQPYTYQTR